MIRLSAGLIARFRADQIAPGHVARPLAEDVERLAARLAAELPDTMETRHALRKLAETRGAILAAAGWKPRPRRRVAAILPEPTGPACYGLCAHEVGRC